MYIAILALYPCKLRSKYNARQGLDPGVGGGLEATHEKIITRNMRRVRVSVYPSVCLFIYRSVCVFLSFDLQYIFICTSICLSTDLSIYLFTYLSIPLSIYSCLSVYLADILSQSVIQLICLSINQAIPLSWHSSSFAVALSHSYTRSLLSRSGIFLKAGCPS